MVERACLFEKEWLSRGFTLDDLAYYTMPGHEDEACEAIGDERLCEKFLEDARNWYNVTFEYETLSACEALEKLKPGIRATE